MMATKSIWTLLLGGMLGWVSSSAWMEYHNNSTQYSLAKHPQNIEHDQAIVRDQVDQIVLLNTSIHDPMLDELSKTYRIDREEMGAIWGNVLQESDAHSIDPFLLMAIIQEESGYRRKAKSSAGALGLTQVMPQVHRSKLNHGEVLTDPRVSIRVGTQVLKEYLVIEQGNLRRALQRYNGSLKDSRQKYAKHILAEQQQLERLHIQSLLAAGPTRSMSDGHKT